MDLRSSVEYVLNDNELRRAIAIALYDPKIYNSMERGAHKQFSKKYDIKMSDLPKDMSYRIAKCACSGRWNKSKSKKGKKSRKSTISKDMSLKDRKNNCKSLFVESCLFDGIRDRWNNLCKPYKPTHCRKHINYDSCTSSSSSSSSDNSPNHYTRSGKHYQCKPFRFHFKNVFFSDSDSCSPSDA